MCSTVQKIPDIQEDDDDDVDKNTFEDCCTERTNTRTHTHTKHIFNLKSLMKGDVSTVASARRPLVCMFSL